MKKFDWNKPITWKGYLKLCGIISAVSSVLYAIFLCVEFEWAKNWRSKKYPGPIMWNEPEKMDSNEEN